MHTERHERHAVVAGTRSVPVAPGAEETVLEVNIAQEREEMNQVTESTISNHDVQANMGNIGGDVQKAPAQRLSRLFGALALVSFTFQRIPPHHKPIQTITAVDGFFEPPCASSWMNGEQLVRVFFAGQSEEGGGCSKGQSTRLLYMNSIE